MIYSFDSNKITVILRGNINVCTYPACGAMSETQNAKWVLWVAAAHLWLTTMLL